MKIPIYIYFLLTLINAVLCVHNEQQKISNNNPSTENNVKSETNNNHNIKRDSSDQLGSYENGKSLNQQQQILPSMYQQPPPHQQMKYYQTSSHMSPTISPEFAFIKPPVDTKYQYAPNSYYAPVISVPPSASPFSNSPFNGKFKLASSPYQIIYAQPPPVQYAIALAPVHHTEATKQQIILAPRPQSAHASNVPITIIAIPHSIGQQLLSKNFGVQYATIMPAASEFPIIKYPTSPSQPIINHPPSASLYHQPLYAYTVQPSYIPVAPSAKQISLPPPVSITSPGAPPPHIAYKHQPVNPHQSTSFSSFAQHVSASPVKVSPIVSNSMQGPAPVITSTTPNYGGTKVLRDNGQSLSNNFIPSTFIQPRAIHSNFSPQFFNPGLAKIGSFFANIPKY